MSDITLLLDHLLQRHQLLWAEQLKKKPVHHNKPFVFVFDWIHIFQSNYMHNKLSRKAGARITIHDP